ncbi:hydrogenase maturation protease [Nocardioides sp. KR10-350]|uniref:hydrogenase maturation protease n=1 Tax=Nocardioides cheoyonin TaxID=3156615 RepID=UPI0032B40D9B
MRVLVACVGNIFLGDDGFGSSVAAELARRELPDGVRLEDYGIRSVHLVYELLDGYDLLLLVDTVGRQEGPPGSLYVIEPAVSDVADAPPDGPSLDPHDLPPGGALELVPVLGGHVSRILVVGVQPESLEEGIGLSDPVAAAVVPAADLVLDVLRRELADGFGAVQGRG